MAMRGDREPASPGPRAPTARLLKRAAVLAAAATCVALSAVVILAHKPTIMNIYRDTPLLADQKWKYDKHDLPSAAVRHPVLVPDAWWTRPPTEWGSILASWPEARRKSFPGGVADMEAARARMTREAHESVAHIMEMSEDELVRYVPPQSPVGRRKNYCPACGKGKLAWVGPDDWDRVKCTRCLTVFPNDDYPAERRHAIGSPLGKPVIFRYYRDKKGFNHFFEALTYGPKRDRMMEFGLALAGAYHVTRAAEYALRAALILDRLATVFPHWCMRNGAHPHIYLLCDGWHSATGKFDRWNGRWMFGVPYECISSYEPIYDMIYESEELDLLSEERKYDVRRHIERNLFYENVAVFISAAPPVGPVGDIEHLSVIGAIRRAWVLNDPRLIHRCFAWAESRVAKFSRDGTYGPRIGGGGEVRPGLEKVMAALAGWTDPPDGKSNEWGHPRFVDFDAARYFPILEKLGRAAGTVALPNGLASPIHGTEVVKIAEARPGRCGILPGWGHAVLGAGSERLAVQSHLHFSGDSGDGYRDNLGTMLYAFGRELLSDVGAHDPAGGGQGEQSAHHTVGHSTVVIDRRSQAPGNSRNRRRFTDGDLLMFVPTLPGLSVVEARGERGYPGSAHGVPRAVVYNRMQILVSVDAQRPYVVDVFRVAGGSVHDYVLHGSCEGPMEADTTLPLAPDTESLLGGNALDQADSGEDAPTSSASGYDIFRDVRHGKSSAGAGWRATFRFSDRDALGLRIHVVGGAETEVFLARTPYSRRPSDERERPCLIARRRDVRSGEPGVRAEAFESLYVAVFEPFRGVPGIESVEAVAVEPSDRKVKAIALRIRWRGTGGGVGRTDTLLLCPNGSGRVRTLDGIEFDGRVGFVSEAAASATKAYMIGGTLLRKGELVLETPVGLHEGEIDSVLRTADGDESNALVTSAALPAGAALRGAYVMVTMPGVAFPPDNTSANPCTHGYRIDRIEKDGERTLIHTDGDHGLRIPRDASVVEVYAPRRSYVGTPRFVVYSAVRAP